MTKNSRNFRQTHSLLNHSRPGRVSQTVKRQSVNAAVFNSRKLASSPKASFDIAADSKYRLFIRGQVVKPFQFVVKFRRHRYWSFIQGLCVGGDNADKAGFKVNVRPFQFEDLSLPHSGCQRTDNDRANVLSRAATSGQQSRLFFVGQGSVSASLVGHSDQRIVLLKGNTKQPAFLLGLPEHRPNMHQLPVDAGNGTKAIRNSLLPFLVGESDRGLQAMLFVFLEFAMRDRAEFISAKVFLDGLQQVLLRLPRATALDDPAVSVDRLNQVSVFVPLGEVSKSFLSVGDCAFIVTQFIKFLLQILFGFGSIPTSTPDRMSLAVKSDVGSASIDVFLVSTFLDNDLQLTFAHVYTFLANWLVKFEGKDSAENPHGRAKGAYNQGNRLFLVAGSYVGLLAVLNSSLIVDQEVVGSSPTSRPKFLNKTIEAEPIKWSALFVSISKSPIRLDTPMGTKRRLWKEIGRKSKHRLPKALGGRNGRQKSNLVLACQPCNHGKGMMDVESYRAHLQIDLPKGERVVFYGEAL